VGPTAGLDLTKNRNILLLPRIEPRLFYFNPNQIYLMNVIFYITSLQIIYTETLIFISILKLGILSFFKDFLVLQVLPKKTLFLLEMYAI
jgi:hypothetical protein